MSKKVSILTGSAARSKLVEGAKLVYDCVAPLLGPKSSNAAISRQWSSAYIVHDGVTVARQIESEDPHIHQGVGLVIEAAKKTVSDTGDGTTTATVLTYHLIEKGLKEIEAGTNEIQLRDELDAAYRGCIPQIEHMARKISTTEDVERVATISSTSPEIGRLVAAAYREVGLDGIVTADAATGPTDTLETTSGFSIDTGYAAPHFVTNPDIMVAVIDEPYIVILNKPITDPREFINALQPINKVSKNIVVIGDIKGDALATLVTNKLRGNLNVVVVNLPYAAERRTQALEDIGYMTGARTLSDEIGFDLKAEEFDMGWVGRADRVEVSASRMMITGGRGPAKEKEKHIERVRRLKERAANDFEREMAEERLARLTTGVAVIRVAGKNEIVQRERLERVKDAIGAARAALEEGIVPGAGLAYIRLHQAMPEKNAGQRVLKKALLEPLNRLFENAGIPTATKERIMKHVLTHDDSLGYDMMQGKLVDLVEAGIIDPAKVVRLSLENAVAVAGSILTTSVTIARDIEPLELT